MRTSSIIALAGGKAVNSQVEADTHNYDAIDKLARLEDSFRRSVPMQRLAVKVQIAVEGRLSVSEQYDRLAGNDRSVGAREAVGQKPRKRGRKR